ncbi:MAG: UDP-N-acetylmuramoyl-L-alanyl-D-glutamate--2,6-diaminopimelate ligase [Aquificae bacterium]|nr:UDP-N-acetylmuramoyl-L-alanyl-D-glutamate--2,6-diaminopimelate ligase [Aquificota bacterium]
MKKLYQLFNQEEFIQKGKSNIIKGISNNTEEIKRDYIFFAVKGNKFDGNSFIEKAIQKGAICIVSDNREKLYKIKQNYPDITFVYTPDVRKKVALTAQKFFDYPDKELKIIGITGTNGKTSTANITAQYLKNLGFRVATIGTIGYEFEDRFFGNGMTTPDPIKWYFLLHSFRKLGADYVVSEISSHATNQSRFYGTRFYGGIFTNLTQDHLDYHKDMENYFNSKKRFIEYVLQNNPSSVVSTNWDCTYGRRIYSQAKDKNRIIRYGYSSGDFKILSSKISIHGTTIRYTYADKEGTINTKLLGEFNIYNVSASFSLLLKLGFPSKELENISPRLLPIKGRFEIVSNNGFLVINDYAHTPDALEKILKSLSKFKKNRIISVFGAGGDRDRTKRPLMGEVADRYSDTIILTSDNPRSEKAENIIQQIKEGIKNKDKVIIIIDREMAIKQAIETAHKGDIILIAGKGHETYQIIGNQVYKFDDSDIAKKYLKNDV